MLVSFMIYWWFLPAIVAIVSTFFLPAGPGGFVIAVIGYIIAISMVVGHYTSYMG